MPNKCAVMRDGHEQKVEAHELVPGDLVRLYIGDRVPADIRIIETADLKVGLGAGLQTATANLLSVKLGDAYTTGPAGCEEIRCWSCHR